MNIRHYEKGFHYTDRELIKIAARIGKLATYCSKIKDEDSFIHVEAQMRDTKKERDQFKVMVTIQLPGKTLRAESRHPSPVEGLDRCIEKLEPQVKKYKDRTTMMGKKKR